MMVEELMLEEAMVKVMREMTVISDGKGGGKVKRVGCPRAAPGSAAT